MSLLIQRWECERLLSVIIRNLANMGANMDLIQAADLVKAHAKKYEQLMGVAAELERIGSFDQARREAEAAQGRAVADLEKARGELAVVLGKVGEVRAEADFIIGQAQERAAVIVAEAEGKAARTAEVAEAKIADKIAVAQAKLESIKAEIATAESSRADGVKATAEKLAEIEASIAAKKSEGDHLTQKLAKTRIEIAKLLGS